jgi:hypothetical protein
LLELYEMEKCLRSVVWAGLLAGQPAQSNKIHPIEFPTFFKPMYSNDKHDSPPLCSVCLIHRCLNALGLSDGGLGLSQDTMEGNERSEAIDGFRKLLLKIIYASIFGCIYSIFNWTFVAD